MMSMKKFLLGAIICCYGISGHRTLCDASTVAPALLEQEITFTIPEVIRVDEARVEAHKKNISRRMMLTQVARYGLKGCAAVFMAYAVYRMRFGAADKPDIVASTQVAEKVKKMIDQVQAELSYGGWFKSILRGIRDYLVSAAAGQLLLPIINEPLNSVYHADDIAWFIKAHTDLKIMLEELGAHIDSFEKGGAKNDDMQNIYFIVDTCNGLVNEIEAILGFMEYKKELVTNAALAFEMAANISYLRKITNDLCGNLELRLGLQGSPVDTKKTLSSLLIAFREELMKLVLLQFARLEKKAHIA